MTPLPVSLPNRRRPGLFITGTDTGVGKTLVTCAIAHALHAAGLRVGVCKPFATGCRRDREGLVSEDAEALAHFADCPLPLDIINPIRYRAPLAPAVAAELSQTDPDWPAFARSARLLEAQCDLLLWEGVGGVMVPLQPRQPELTILDLAATLAYPVVVVARAGLGTLNHSALTVAALRHAGLRVLGLVMNGYIPDPAAPSAPPDAHDPSMQSNRAWLSRLTGLPVLAVVPQCPNTNPAQARIPPDILEAVAQVDWAALAQAPA